MFPSVLSLSPPTPPITALKGADEEEEVWSYCVSSLVAVGCDDANVRVLERPFNL